MENKVLLLSVIVTQFVLLQAGQCILCVVPNYPWAQFLEKQSSLATDF